MQIKINILKKHFWMTLTAVFVLTIGVIVYAYSQSIPNPGHGADTVWVSIPGMGEKTLQAAIDDKSIGGGGTLKTCANGQILKYNGTMWDCAIESGGTASVQVYQCPDGLTAGACGSGSWMYLGCIGQISTQATCRNVVWTSGACNDDRNCTSLGRIMVSTS